MDIWYSVFNIWYIVFGFKDMDFRSEDFILNVL